MDIKEEPGESLQVSNADVSDMKIKVEQGLETNSGLESVSLELSHMPEAKSVMAHLSVKMKAPDLCTDLIPELPDTGTELGLRDMTPVVIKSEPEDHTDVPDSDIQDIGSSERCLEPQPVLLVENTAHSGCFPSGPGTSADYAVMSLVTEQTTQMIAVTFEAGDGTYSDCTFNAVVENIAFVATGEGRNPSVLEKEVELSDDDVIIVETGKNDQSTASCCTEPEAHSKAMEMESEESETNEGSGSSDEFDTTPDEAVAVPQQKFECQYCGKAFLTKFYLGKHERLHNGEKPYKCKQCCRYFSAMWQLMDHMHTHAKALDYICKHCGETFKNGSYWRQHERAHANKKLHCHLCGRVFIKKLYLLYHKKSFHGLDVKNKPLKCSSCPKTFHRIQDLDLHRAVHLKYFECDQCGEKFNHKHLMSRHKNKVHLSI